MHQSYYAGVCQCLHILFIHRSYTNHSRRAYVKHAYTRTPVLFHLKYQQQYFHPPVRSSVVSFRSSCRVFRHPPNKTAGNKSDSKIVLSPSRLTVLSSISLSLHVSHYRARSSIVRNCYGKASINDNERRTSNLISRLRAADCVT